MAKAEATTGPPMQRVGCAPAAEWVEKVSAKAVLKPVGSVAKQIGVL